MGKSIRIGTRDSQLAIWQATQVKELLARSGFASELIFIKSEGDIDLVTPLYELGVQGIFTKSLDAALLSGKIDIAVHSMKDVPTQLPEGIIQAAVLPRGAVRDLLVFKNEIVERRYSSRSADQPFTIATSSIRRKAQWLNRYPNDNIENLRGNVNTRLQKLQEGNWDAAIFAQAGLERIGLRPPNSLSIDWMLPAPAQGAVVVLCREADEICSKACQHFNDYGTQLCTRIERDFLRQLLGGCSTPISALAEIKDSEIVFKGNILSVDGSEKVDVKAIGKVDESFDLGIKAALDLLNRGGQKIVDGIRYATK
jgi:hydroxymethylbilane synthase